LRRDAADRGAGFRYTSGVLASRVPRSSLRRPWLGILVFATTVVLGCDRRGSSGDPVPPSARDAQRTPTSPSAPEPGAIEIYEALEAEIEAAVQAGKGKDAVDKDRRQAAHAAIAEIEDDGSATYAFARAAVAGRVAEARGLSALDKVEEAERWGLRSMERDPSFKDGAAQRLVGTLYVMAGKHTEHGDSERGLELLEALVETYPDDPVNRVRVAEGYVTLGDPEGAFDPLCVALDGRDALPPGEARLLDALVEQVGGEAVLACGD